MVEILKLYYISNLVKLGMGVLNYYFSYLKFTIFYPKKYPSLLTDVVSRYCFTLKLKGLSSLIKTPSGQDA